jgi:hypothetical protein
MCAPARNQGAVNEATRYIIYYVFTDLNKLEQLEAALKAKNASLCQHTAESHGPLSTEKQLQEIKAENTLLRHQLYQETLLSSKLQRQLSETSAEKQHEQAKAEELKAENAILHEGSQIKLVQLDVLKNKLSEATKEKKYLEAESTTIQQHLQEARLHSFNLQKLLSDVSKNNEQQQAENKILQQHLQEEKYLSATLHERLSELSAKNESLVSAQQESVAFGIEPWKVSRTDVQLNSVIGGGGWGVVHKGNLKVAVKQFYPNILSERNLVRLKREMRILALVRHPNILQFIAAVFDESGDHKKNPPYIITELLDTSLRTLYEEGPISEKNQVSIFLDTARALDYLHQRYEPIIHRDVSSANILLKHKPRSNTWLAKLSDLGSANLAQEAYTMNEGARVYCAPEAFTFDTSAQSDVTLTPKVDIYSYGVMLCEVATCTFPEAKKMPSMLEQVSVNWLPLYRVIVSCTKDNPEDRPTMARIFDTLIGFPLCE